ncbi:uncharacterized protein N7498_010628 [Penicillium cinerascens]|uniref:Transmembrane protein n=1 Tax=Penicillium cinerascens TaxID=70096 RepID=A0A9W9J7S4_9EURO|nr:uncharacterized protein N7498_010628 [Penicillium cinerascens]KAJ5191643.1 hypothetical protein N7498_010628 [Penicillium cinerascens]
MVAHSTLFALLSLALFVSLAAGAAIPFSHLQPEDEKASTPVEAASWPALRSTESGDNETLAKRAPFYFPETVPDAEEIASRLTSMREAGFVADSQTQKSMGVPDPGMDTHARILPIQDTMSELSAYAEPCSPKLLPPMAFLIFAACATCVTTVVRKINCKH